MSPPVQAASIVAWQDEAHVVENRRLYREKFEHGARDPRPVAGRRHARRGVLPLGAHAGPGHRVRARGFTSRQAVSVLPGSYLAREAHG